MADDEKYLEWLDREEDVLGLDAMMFGSESKDNMFLLLKQELGYEPTDSQVNSMFDAATQRYEIMPEVEVSYDRIWHPEHLGYQSTYRDTTTGRFISRADVQARIRGE